MGCHTLHIQTHEVSYGSKLKHKGNAKDIRKVDIIIGRESRNRIAATEEADKSGAFAALESSYYSLNKKDVEIFKGIRIGQEVLLPVLAGQAGDLQQIESQEILLL